MVNDGGELGHFVYDASLVAAQLVDECVDIVDFFFSSQAKEMVEPDSCYIDESSALPCVWRPAV